MFATTLNLTTFPFALTGRPYMPHLRADIVIPRVLPLQSGLEPIHILQRKRGLVDALHAQQHIQQPALGIDIPRGPHKLAYTCKAAIDG